MTEAERIAAGLSEAQRFWMLAAKKDGDLLGGGYCIGHPLANHDHASPRRFFLTSQGLEVRALLKGTE